MIEPKQSPADPRQNATCALVGIVVLAVLFFGLLLGPCSKARPAEWAVESQRILAGPDRLKADLVRQALAHEAKPKDCRFTLYHPRESVWQGIGSYLNWVGTATGTKVKPGVASCTVANRDLYMRFDRRLGWLRAWMWVEGYGVCRVEDVFPGFSYPSLFDLASPGPPYGYQEWLDSTERARYAYDFGSRRSTVVIIKPVGGWEQD